MDIFPLPSMLTVAPLSKLFIKTFRSLLLPVTVISANAVLAVNNIPRAAPEAAPNSFDLLVAKLAHMEKSVLNPLSMIQHETRHTLNGSFDLALIQAPYCLQTDTTIGSGATGSGGSLLAAS